jgi:predicted ATPase/class 3 adenylate cyclase
VPDQSLPSGVVTFVLTDIEGSTRMLRRLEERYDDVLERHISLLREVWESYGGVYLGATGDSCFAAFPDAADAVLACGEAQRRLAEEPWRAEERPRVRMGIHTGLASPRGDGYVALAVHQTARVMTAAHGGQVLVTEATIREVEDLHGLELRSVGRYRLRDFDEPVQLYSVIGEGMQREFPAIRAMPVDGHNLVASQTSLIGRDEIVTDVEKAFAADRLVTLTGPGGVGKTRVAIAVGLSMAGGWDDGVWFVDLSPLRDGALIGLAVASAIGATRTRSGDDWHDALDHLRKRRALLILDNCEHLIADAAARVSEVLLTCPEVCVLATSREPLGVAGERITRIDPLRVPEAHALDGAAAVKVPSVRLFVERARAARPDFPFDADSIGVVVEICRRLDGLPLALELAAAHAALLSPADLLDGLDRGFLLQSRDRDRPERQRTMDAVFDWSFQLLAPEEQHALRCLGIFVGGFSLEGAVAAIATDDDRSDAAAAVWSLVDASLVAVDLSANATRYRMLETVREQARSRLDAEGETLAVAERLASWALDRIGPWHPMDRTRSGEIEVELDTVRALVPHLAQDATEQAQQLACSIGRYYYTVHTSHERTAELAQYAADLAAPSPARVSLLGTLALLHLQDGDVDAARRVVDDAVRASEAAGGAPPWDDVCVDRAIGEVEVRSGNYDAAAQIARQTLERELSPRGRGRMLNLLGLASHFGGDDESAAVAFKGELETACLLGDEHLMAIAEGNVAELALRGGDAGTAAQHQAACLDLALALGRPASVAHSLIVAARLTADSDPARAVALNAKAERVLSEAGEHLYDDDLHAIQQMLDLTEQRLGDDEFRRACERGRGLTLPDAALSAQGALAEIAT